MNAVRCHKKLIKVDFSRARPRARDRRPYSATLRIHACACVNVLNKTPWTRAHVREGSDPCPQRQTSGSSSWPPCSSPKTAGPISRSRTTWESRAARWPGGRNATMSPWRWPRAGCSRVAIAIGDRSGPATAPCGSRIGTVLDRQCSAQPRSDAGTGMPITAEQFRTRIRRLVRQNETRNRPRLKQLETLGTPSRADLVSPHFRKRSGSGRHINATETRSESEQVSRLKSRGRDPCLIRVAPT